MSKEFEINESKEFVPVKEEKVLIELGFPAYNLFGYYGKGGNYQTYTTGILWQQAFRWFVEKYRIHISFGGDHFSKPAWFDYTIHQKKGKYNSKHGYGSIEEASLAALRELIKIAKNERVTKEEGLAI